MIKQVIFSVLLSSLSLLAMANDEILEREPINKEGISRFTYEINLPLKMDNRNVDKVCAMKKLYTFSETLKDKDSEFKHIGIINENSEQFVKVKKSENLTIYKHDHDYIIYLDMKKPAVYYSKQLGSKDISQWVILEQDTLKDCILK